MRRRVLHASPEMHVNLPWLHRTVNKDLVVRSIVASVCDCFNEFLCFS